jgi:hypothetical protein
MYAENVDLTNQALLQRVCEWQSGPGDPPLEHIVWPAYFNKPERTETRRANGEQLQGQTSAWDNDLSNEDVASMLICHTLCAFESNRKTVNSIYIPYSLEISVGPNDGIIHHLHPTPTPNPRPGSSFCSSSPAPPRAKRPQFPVRPWVIVVSNQRFPYLHTLRSYCQLLE